MFKKYIFCNFVGNVYNVRPHNDLIKINYVFYSV